MLTTLDNSIREGVQSRTAIERWDGIRRAPLEQQNTVLAHLAAEDSPTPPGLLTPR